MSRKRRGDRRDGRRVKAPGLQTVMTALLPKRTESEVFLHETFDATELVRYLEKKNEGVPKENRIKIFHCIVTALARMLRERPLMNRFIAGYRVYERDEVSLSFVAKRRFSDGAEEALMFMVPKDEDSLEDVSRKIIGDVKQVRKSEHATGGVDELLDKFAAMPRLLMVFLVRIIRWLDFWGKNPSFITQGDPNYSSVLISNLGSIRCPAVYHHLNNYGTNSVMVTVGMLHKEERLMEDGTKQLRDVIDMGVTIDERIADGFYFARSLKLMHHIFENPALLEKPLGENSGFTY